MNAFCRSVAGAALLLLALVGAPPIARAVPAQEGSSNQLLRIESVEVTPAKPGKETLCQLEVVLRNDGERAASQLAFEVRLDGEPLPVYERQLFYKLVPAGGSTSLRLFNFWTSETGRPPPGDGSLEVEVVLREAQWIEVAKETSTGDTATAGEVETWTPVGEVPALPSAAKRQVPIEGN